MLVFSDVVDPKFAALRPTKENPVYHDILGGAERTLDDPIAGEPMPKREQLKQEIERAMASHGFTLTTELENGQPVTIIDRKKGETVLLLAADTPPSAADFAIPPSRRRRIASTSTAHPRPTEPKRIALP